MEMHKIIKKILLTEKSNVDRETGNKYHFEVDRKANKVEIGHAVEKLFKVKVTDVHVFHVLGKKKRMGKVMGQKSSWKKAIVTLAEGSRIEVAEGV
ncbi:MAG: 50S ribosomal protein L23 [Smithellaceae bacterium]|jgi:large subunit ribosomal protein L23|nr:50S ribosomal protein L23 [Smithella sp. F21]MDD4861036.1 50S ribosomal protein L23 [Smithellaceae bacterium]HBJ75723.1 50S ribosomal protein L23 [Syntrophaceae bacterium]MDD5413217.1 50S ribosomal protein L23 [Smithellaceae bacterium]HBL54206.1 50S ribosomal protein L23 [Syntrophaceae bacterium]